VPEGNGSGHLDRIEANLEEVTIRLNRLAAAQELDHEEFKRDHQQLMTWQVLMQDKMDKFSADRDAERSALGEHRQAHRGLGIFYRQAHRAHADRRRRAMKKRTYGAGSLRDVGGKIWEPQN
jgi:hypothetical protein